jgi:hypothetical protein
MIDFQRELRLQQHDAFRCWHGLGSTGLMVVSAMERGAARPKDIIRMSGRCRQTVFTKLRDMIRVGLVEPMGDGVYRLVDAWETRLDDAAECLGTAGKGAAQAAQHQREREAWRKRRKGV